MSGISWLFILGALLSLYAVTDLAYGNNAQNERKARINNLQIAIKDANQVIKSAESRQKYLQNGIKQTEQNLELAIQNVRYMESQLAETERLVADATPEIQGAREEARRASAELTSVEARLVAEQPSDSPLRRAEAEYKRLQDSYTQVKQTIEANPEFQKAYQAAINSSDKLKEVGQVREQWIQRNPQLSELSAQMAIARSSYEQARDAAIRADPAWQQASQAVAAARRLEEEFETKARIVLTNKADAASKLRRAQGIATSLQNTIVAAKRASQQTASDKARAVSRRDKLRRDLENLQRRRR